MTAAGLLSSLDVTELPRPCADKQFARKRVLPSRRLRGGLTRAVGLTPPKVMVLDTNLLFPRPDDARSATESTEANNCLASWIAVVIGPNGFTLMGII